MLLDGKNAIIYGAGGAIGGAIGKAFAAQGARVHLTGRTLATLDKLAAEIREAGGQAQTAEVDAMDEAAVDAHADAVGTIDISVNVTATHDVQGTPMVEMSVDDYLAPVTLPVRSRFITSRAAARHMIPRRSGVILFFGGDGDRSIHQKFQVGGLVTGFVAVEAMRRQLAGELGQYGIRVITLQSAGIAESLPADFPGRDELAEKLTEPSPLGRTATLADVGNVAVFAASDLAASMTGTQLNLTCGAFID
jgi:NAD(P)-dependent dehydrogenase (short-subunit alcohol dehydrogenase family)